MKFKVRYLIEKETEVDTKSAQHAVDFVESALKRSGLKTKVLGAIGEGHVWSDQDNTVTITPPKTPSAA